MIISKKFKIVVDNNEIELYFKRPNRIELYEVDLEYRRIYSEAVRLNGKGILTEAEAKKIFARDGSWTRLDENKISLFSLQIAQMEKQLEDEKLKKKEKIEIANNISKIRADFLDLIGTKTTLFNNTAEGIANEQKMHKFIELCCLKSNGERFFQDSEEYNQFVSEHADELADIFKQAHLFEYDLPDDITETWSEVQFMKKVNEEKSQKKTRKKKEKVLK